MAVRVAREKLVVRYLAKDRKIQVKVLVVKNRKLEVKFLGKVEVKIVRFLVKRSRK